MCKKSTYHTLLTHLYLLDFVLRPILIFKHVVTCKYHTFYTNNIPFSLSTSADNPSTYTKDNVDVFFLSTADKFLDRKEIQNSFLSSVSPVCRGVDSVWLEQLQPSRMHTDPGVHTFDTKDTGSLFSSKAKREVKGRVFYQWGVTGEIRVPTHVVWPWCGYSR